MNAITIVSIAGLITTLLGGLGAPLVYGRVAAKNASAARLQEQQKSAYADAIVYAQIIEERLDDLLADPMTRSEQSRPPNPDDLMIRARLFLAAPDAVTTAFGHLIAAWKTLTRNLNEAGQSGPHGEYEAEFDDPDVLSTRSS